MISQVSFPARLLLPSSDLPLTLISLEDWVLVMINGADTIKFLQGQLTCDIAALNTNRFSFSAHCDIKGKTLSCLYVFYYREGIAFIERRSVYESQLAELKKYAIFSKIIVNTCNDIILLGLAGFQAPDIISELFNYIPNNITSVVHQNNLTLLYFSLPSPRFLLITTSSTLNELKYKLMHKIQFNNSQQWLSLDIEAGYPIIDKINSLKFIPQAINIKTLGGISFNKGCYIGQEVVARAEYRGLNKRGIYWLIGNAIYLPSAGSNLELKINKNWRQTGTILAACRLKNDCIWVQAVLNNDLSHNSMLRISNDNTSLFYLHPVQGDKHNIQS